MWINIFLIFSIISYSFYNRTWNRFICVHYLFKCIFGKCRTIFCISNSIKLFLSDARETTGVMVKPLDLRDFLTSRGMLEEMITSFPSQLERGNVLEKHWPRLKIFTFFVVLYLIRKLHPCFLFN